MAVGSMADIRVAIAGLLHESNTFLGRPTTYEDFASTSLSRGAALIERLCGFGNLLTSRRSEPASEPAC